MSILISDHAYAMLAQAAQVRGVIPEALVETLTEQLPIGFTKDEDAFYRAMGMDDAQIVAIKQETQSLPDDPQW